MIEIVPAAVAVLSALVETVVDCKVTHGTKAVVPNKADVATIVLLNDPPL